MCVFMGQFLMNSIAGQWLDPWACRTGGKYSEERKERGFTIRDLLVEIQW